ncbi:MULTISPECIES: MFS transporter [Arsenicicoccus]|uniref:MFS transporter n=1 Tax=Arsenicicoccus TaxID=267408 RepID=UPI00257A4212|nr:MULTISPECIES: MFS transporter [Arsenicicoccus]
MSTIPDRAASPQSAEPAEPAETTDHLLQDTHLPGSSATRTVKQMAETYWILALSCAALIFDGYDIVVYGTIVSRLLKDPSQLGSLNAAQAGTIGSYALIGVMIGALAAGAVGDHIGRRKIVLGSIAWFSIGMALTAVSMNFTYFGAMRLLTGIGLGALLATLGAVVAEFAPIDKKNLFNALVYSGIPAGGVLASIIALVALPIVGWRGLFWIGALPLVILLPFAWKKIPESPKWLEAKGRHEEAQRVAERTGVALDGAPARSSSATGSTGSIESAPVAPQAVERVGFRGLFTGSYLVPTILLGFMSFSGLLLTYGLNTWLPRIMESYGFNATYSLTFLLLLNTGSIIGGLVIAALAGPTATAATAFYVFAGVAVFGALVCALVPKHD